MPGTAIPRAAEQACEGTLAAQQNREHANCVHFDTLSISCRNMTGGRAAISGRKLAVSTSYASLHFAEVAAFGSPAGSAMCIAMNAGAGERANGP